MAAPNTAKVITGLRRQLRITQGLTVIGFGSLVGYGYSLGQRHHATFRADYEANSNIYSTSVNLQPVDSQPVDSQPTDLQPANSQPENSQPTDLQPVNSQPVNSQPEKKSSEEKSTSWW